MTWMRIFDVVFKMTEKWKNTCFYMLEMIVCGMLFTACGTQELSTDNLAEQAEEMQTNLLNSEILNVNDEDDAEDADLSEEQLYWIDHEERITVLENPTRRFVEIRAIDTERATADDSGVVLQEDTVRLCIDQVDMITFGDMNKDKYIDMQIDYPSHQDETYPTKWWDFPSYMLWNTELEIFEHKTEREVRSSLHAHINMIAEEGSREYIVQQGDCLWSISERFLGSGLYWTTLQREENAPEDPNYLLPGEIIYIPNGINFP